MRRISMGLAALAALIGLTACGDEAPTAVGGELLGDGLQTLELVLEAPQWLVQDTSFDDIGSLAYAAFGFLANDFAGELDANVIFKIERPFLVSWEDTTGTTQTDSLEAIRGGTLTVILDSIGTPPDGTAFEVLDLTEGWDPRTASWTHRVDSTGASVPWTIPGGSTGSVRATAAWDTTMGDTFRIAVDSAQAAVWQDTIAAAWGGLVRPVDPGVRVRIRTVRFAWDVVPTGADTVLTAGQAPVIRTVASPDVPVPDGTLRVGGVPVWRSMLRLQDLRDFSVPCEPGPTTCFVSLSEATVNAANVILSPVPVGGRRPEAALRVQGRTVLEGPGTTLNRAPLSRPFGRMTSALPVSAFEDPSTGEEAVLPMTDYIRQILATEEDTDRPLWMAITAEREGGIFQVPGLFGYAQFAGLGSASPPRLQLVLTIPAREEL